jgi:hypothetical protein
MIPGFERRHPEIHVRVQMIPWNAAHEKLLTAFAGTSLPDMCQLGNTWLPELTALDALEPLDALVANSAIARSDYFAGILVTNVMPTPSGDRLFGLPWYVDTRVLFYRSDLLRAAGHPAPPQSWAEWLAAMRAVRQRGGGRSYGVLLPLNEPDPLFALALQQGPLLSDDDSRGAFTQAPFRRALGFYAGIFREGLAPALTARQDDLLDRRGPAIHHHRNDRRHLPLAVQLHHLPDGRAESERQPFVSRRQVHDDGKRGVPDLRKKERRMFALLLEPRRDRRHAESRVDLLVDNLDVVGSGLEHVLDVSAQIFGHYGDSSSTSNTVRS